MKPARLFTPGPTEVPPAVLETQARPLINHRTDAFREVHFDCIRGMQQLMGTKDPVVITTSSGTGAMESVVVNYTQPGEKVLVTRLGKFSERWRDICQAYGLETVVIETEWGKATDPQVVEDAFKANPGISCLFTTHSETSTGTIQDVKTFAEIARRHGALIAVDGITSVGAERVLADEWELDAVVGGSQKGVFIPPGLGFTSVSERAQEKMAKGRHPVFYFDLIKAVKGCETGNTPWTPAVSLMCALQKSLELILDEGLDNVIKRHAAHGTAVRAAATAMGLKLLSSNPANCCTAIVPPDDTAGPITKMMEKDYGVKVAGGQGPLKGKIFRLGHLGYYFETDMYTMISALEASCVRLGVTSKFGPGVEALQAAYEELAN